MQRAFLMLLEQIYFNFETFWFKYLANLLHKRLSGYMSYYKATNVSA